MNVEIKVTATRNPHYVTFSLEQPLIGPGTGLTFSDPESAEGYPLPKALFQIRGVKSIWVLGNDIQVTKDEKVRWSSIQSRIIETIRNATNSQ